MGKLNWCYKITTAITESMEKFFYFWGYNIGLHPFRFICGCVLLCTLCCFGLLNFHQETRMERLFVPVDSKFYNTTVWFVANFPPPFRQEVTITTAEDVLQPEVIQQMLIVHQRVVNFTISSGNSWEDFCFKIPVIAPMANSTEIMKGIKNRIFVKREISTMNETENDEWDFTNFLDTVLPFQKAELITTQLPKEKESKLTSSDKLLIAHNFDFESEFTANVFSSNKENVTTDLSVAMPTELYCALVESLPKACWEYSILELWKYDPEVIGKLTKEDIVNAVNTVKRSPVFGTMTNYEPLLGGVQKDSNGNIISAHSIFSAWHLEVNYSNIQSVDEILDVGLSDPADPDTLEWELGFLNVILGGEYGNTKVLVRAWRSFSDLGVESLKGGFFFMFFGCVTMFMYILMMISDLGYVETKILTASMGVIAVAMAFVSSTGICSFFGVSYGPIHLFNGILLLALGVDDMFVIIQCYDTLSDEDKVKPLEERIGLTMKNAGVSITVTSLTDFIAFMVGSTTKFPFMSSMCIYISVGILVTFVLQATFVVAWLTVELNRISQNRNAVILWYKHKKNLQMKHSPKQLLQLGFDKFSFLFRNTYFKIAVLFTTLSLIGVSIWGVTNIQILFLVEWILPDDSYLIDFTRTFYADFQTHGADGLFIFADVNYTELNVIDDFISEVRSHPDIVTEMGDWYTDFKEYVNTNFNEDVPQRPILEEQFNLYLGQFLFSSSGAQHQKNFRFNDTLQCGKPVPPFQVSVIPFRMRGFKGATEHVPAMQTLRRIADDVTSNSTGGWVAPWSQMFVLWEADEHATEDTIRALLLASFCVFICTLVALSTLPASLLVMASVSLTLFEVLGFLDFVGLQVGILNCVSLVFCIGVSVDFSTHFVHRFLTNTGTKTERVCEAFRDIGPAILNGGLSTVLACMFLLKTNANVYIIVMKTVMMAVWFGMYNGLLLLPVLLTIIGPDPYSYAKAKNNIHDDDDVTISLQETQPKKPFISTTVNTKSYTITDEERNEKENLREDIILNVPE